MKKVFLALTAAMVCVALAACGNKNAEPAEDIEAEPETEVINEPAPATTEAACGTDMNARAQAIHEAAMAVCNCGDILNCMNTVIDQTFEQYKEDADFKAAVKAEAESCIANKVKDAAVDAGKAAAKDAAKKGLEALTK